MVRLRRVLFAVLPALLALAGPASGQDFDPHGRHRPAPRPVPHPGGTPGAHRSPSPVLACPRRADRPRGCCSSGTRGSCSPSPASAFPLQRLAQLYRERDGNIAKLVADFEQRAAQAGADQYAATVSLAGLYRIDGRVDDAVKTLELAIAAQGGRRRPPSSRSRTCTRTAATRPTRSPATSRRCRCSPLQADKEQTLRTLMGLALDVKDYGAASGFHKQLVALEPSSLFVKGELGRELYNRNEFDARRGRAQGRRHGRRRATTGPWRPRSRTWVRRRPRRTRTTRPWRR